MGLTAVDSSLLIPAVVPWHVEHELADRVVGQATDLRMIGHVMFETYSWLTRNRPRTPPRAAARLLGLLPGPALVLSPEGHIRALEVAGEAGIMGGAIYDALIAATALEADARLLSRDERAARTYEAIGVKFELVA
jgi:predicted nucleic acid-binding protein